MQQIFPVQMKCVSDAITVSITRHLHFSYSADTAWYKSGVCSFALKIEVQAPGKQNTFSMAFKINFSNNFIFHFSESNSAIIASMNLSSGLLISGAGSQTWRPWSPAH